MFYLSLFIISFLLSIVLTTFVKKLALRWQIVDSPEIKISPLSYKLHRLPVPLLGGLAIFLSYFLVLGLLVATHTLPGGLRLKNLIGVFLASLVLISGGFLDDKYNLKPKTQLFFSILAVLTVITFGVGINIITNPLGGVIHLNQWQKVLFWWQGTPHTLTLPADLFTFIWLLLLMYTTKLLDGLDGLVSGITGIGAMMIFFLALSSRFYQPSIAVLAIILAGVYLGFLIFNWHPASIFLGNSGSLWAGFMLGILAIIAGGKIATTLLVIGIPLLDLFWVLARRIFKEKRSPFGPGDRKHLHFRLLEIGLSPRVTVLFLYLMAFSFGVLTLVLQAQEKLIALGILGLVMMILVVSIVKRPHIEKERKEIHRNL